MTDRPAGRVLDAALELLDRQIVDREGDLAGKVDDVEFELLPDGSYVAVAILSGPGALGPRLGGRLGRAVSAMFVRLHPDVEPTPARISFGVVRELGPRIGLTISRHHLDVDGMERWVRDNVIGRIPGAGHAPQ